MAKKKQQDRTLVPWMTRPPEVVATNRPAWVEEARKVLARAAMAESSNDVWFASTLALREVSARAFDVKLFGDWLTEIAGEQGTCYLDEVFDAQQEVSRRRLQGLTPDEIVAASKHVDTLLQKPDVGRWQRSLIRGIRLHRQIDVMIMALRNHRTPAEVRDRISEQIDAAFSKLSSRSDHNALRFDVIEAVRFVSDFHLPDILNLFSQRGLLARDVVQARCGGWTESALLVRSLIAVQYPDAGARASDAALAAAADAWGSEDVWACFESLFRQMGAGTLPGGDIKTQYYREKSGMKGVSKDPARRFEMWRQLADLLDILGCGRVSPEALDDEWRRLEHP